MRPVYGFERDLIEVIRASVVYSSESSIPHAFNLATTLPRVALR